MDQEEEKSVAVVLGTDVIRTYLKTMPTSPGVYRMLDVKGAALYVGKAKNLKNRVSNYANMGQLSQRIARMVSQCASMEIVTTTTEAEALLLEANLVKRLNPRYNILLRDDKSFPFIRITGDHDFPRIVKHRGAQNAPGEYFGPFATVSAVNEALATLQKAFLLRPCSDAIFASRTRPCLQYQIKRCSAPCVEKIGREEYGKLIAEARAFLKGKSRDIQDALVKEMEVAAANMDYEYAASLRDRIKALTRVQQEQRLSCPSISDADVIGIARTADKSCVQVFFFRAGQNFGNRAFYPSHSADASNGDILEAFIGQFYQNNTPPKLLMMSEALPNQALLEDALTLRYQGRGKVEIQQPQRGDKFDAVRQVNANASEALTRHLDQHATQSALLEGVAKLFDMDEAPKRIEVYDNSHIMGAHALGAMIVAGPEGFIKTGYRKFNHDGDKPVTPGDDFAMMRAMLTRRFAKIADASTAESEATRPQLVLIDGGAQQLKVVCEVMAELGIVGVTVVAIAKGRDRNAGREWFHMEGRTPFQLPPHDAVLHYLQRLRDESHRFVIGGHRQKRSAAIVKSELDTIPGIGASRKKALLHHFGSARAVSSATLADLESVTGINKKTAQTIYNHFHS